MVSPKDELTDRQIADALNVEVPSAAGMPSKNADEIPAPEVTIADSGAYMFMWNMANGEQIGAKVEWPVIQNRELWVMLSIYYRKNQNVKRPAPLLTRTRWNLRSTSNTDGQIRTLNRRGSLQWDARLEQMKAEIESRLHSSASELVWFGNNADPKPVEYLLYPFLEENQHTVIAAYGGSTKSLFGLAAAISIADGVPILPGTTVNKKGKTLYIDYEADIDTHERRYKQLLAGNEVTDISENVAYLKLTTPIIDSAEVIIGLIRKHGFTNTVIDSASRAVGGDTIDEASVIAYFNMTAQFKTTILTIAHKPKDEKSKGPSGSSHWYHQARSYWELVKDQTHGEDAVSIALKHEKSNNGMLQRTMAFDLTFSETAISYHRADAADNEVIAEGLPPLDKIVAFLKHNPASQVSEIAEQTFLKQPRITGILKRKEGSMFFGSPETYNRRWSLLQQDTPVEKKGKAQWWNED